MAVTAGLDVSRNIPITPQSLIVVFWGVFVGMANWHRLRICVFRAGWIGCACVRRWRLRLDSLHGKHSWLPVRLSHCGLGHRMVGRTGDENALRRLCVAPVAGTRHRCAPWVDLATRHHSCGICFGQNCLDLMPPSWSKRHSGPWSSSLSGVDSPASTPAPRVRALRRYLGAPNHSHEHAQNLVGWLAARCSRLFNLKTSHQPNPNSSPT